MASAGRRQGYGTNTLLGRDGFRFLGRTQNATKSLKGRLAVAQPPGATMAVTGKQVNTRSARSKGGNERKNNYKIAARQWDQKPASPLFALRGSEYPVTRLYGATRGWMDRLVHLVVHSSCLRHRKRTRFRAAKSGTVTDCRQAPSFRIGGGGGGGGGALATVHKSSMPHRTVCSTGLR